MPPLQPYTAYQKTACWASFRIGWSTDKNLKLVTGITGKKKLCQSLRMTHLKTGVSALTSFQISLPTSTQAHIHKYIYCCQQYCCTECWGPIAKGNVWTYETEGTRRLDKTALCEVSLFIPFTKYLWVIKSKSMSRAEYVGKGIKILVGKDCSRDHRCDLDVVQTQY